MKTRPVKYKKWVPKKEGKGYEYTDYQYEATFHQFGLADREWNDTVTTYSTAILELPDGTVIQVEANEIMFTDKA